MTKEIMLPELSEINGIENTEIRHLSDYECTQMAAFFYDRYMWSTDDRNDLYKAAAYKHLRKERARYTRFIRTKTVDQAIKIWANTEPVGAFIPELEQLAKEEFPDAF